MSKGTFFRELDFSRSIGFGFYGLGIFQVFVEKAFDWYQTRGSDPPEKCQLIFDLILIIFDGAFSAEFVVLLDVLTSVVVAIFSI